MLLAMAEEKTGNGRYIPTRLGFYASVLKIAIATRLRSDIVFCTAGRKW